jgi:hypothetical protein
MSSALAIAAVTAVLRDLLQNGLIDAAPATGADVKVTALPPNRLATGSTEVSGVNLFMYHVTPNQGWRNVGLPTFNGNGDRVGNPPLALDLHYLLSAYGAEDLHTDVLLGYAMQLLHETPVITRDAITRAFPTAGVVVDAIDPNDPVPDLPTALQKIAESDLADQVELVKFTPETLTTEEMARLWAAFQAPYRPTALYRASVVLIERGQETRLPLPVLQRTMTAQPMRQPVVTAILPADRSDRLILPGSDVLVLGRDLRGEQTRVVIDGNSVPEDYVAEITSSRIKLRLPDTLRAGVHAAQVVHSWLIGVPPLPHDGVQSDAASFVLHPAIRKDDAGQYQIVVVDVPAETGPRRTRFTIALHPAVAPGQRVLLELLRPGDVALAYLGEGAPSAADPHQVVIELVGVEAANYLGRVRVDGAESPLDLDLATGTAVAPLVTVDTP